MLFRMLLAVGGLLAIYGTTLSEMGHVWWHDNYSIHGLFVPLFSAHFLWTDRKRLFAAAGKGDGRGLWTIVGGLVLFAAGVGLHSLLLRGWSFVIVLMGLCLWAFGRQWLRVAAFPITFLFLMVPFPHAVIESVTIYLQKFAASFAGVILAAVGVPSYQEGVHVYLPNITLEIAEICNGLRFLMALLVLTIAFAEILLPTWRRKAILVLSVFPVAILANAIRVAVVSLGAYYIGLAAAEGPLHHWIGKAVWILTLVPMGLIAHFLRRYGTSAKSSDVHATVLKPDTEHA
jgi:exosortase